MFKKLMVAVDFDEGRGEFLKCLGGLKDFGVREAVVAFCVDVPDIAGVRASLKEILGGELDALCEIARQSGIEAHSEILIGSPASTMADAGERLGCSMIVVASRIRTLFGETIMGSAAHTAMCHARLPLLVLRLRESDEETSCRNWPCLPLERILFPTDFSDNAEHALRTVKALVERTKTAVTLLHVQDQGKWGRHLESRLDEFNRIDRDRMARISDDLTKSGAADVTLDLRTGYPAREVIAAAGEKGVSCVVMGSQGRGFFGEMAIGSVSHNVARRAPVPVLLIPAVLP